MEITAAELPAAMAIMQAMIEDAKELDEKFEKYDVNKSGELETDQLASLLKDLNNGEEVSQGDVDLVMQQADVSGSGAIKREELKPAIMIWYSMGDGEAAES
jgi:Ca2+-binding EF-hand superfamily protein